MNKVRANLLQIQKEIAPYTPNIIAVTKYFDESSIIAAYEAGLRDFGESRVLEALDKIQKLPKKIQENSRFHLIGHLQTNKVRKAVGNFEYIHSIDSLKLAGMVSEVALELGIVQKILLQVNNANEIQKFGFSPEKLFEDFEQIFKLKGIEIVGLMNIAPLKPEKRSVNELFKEIVQLKDELEKRFNCKLKEISMGMSGDYKEAVVAGATMLRIGRKLFS
jgi:pyridoxal phosphate enzyme (YggS family)